MAFAVDAFLKSTPAPAGFDVDKFLASPEGAAPRGDIITPEELYKLGWSPESLKSKLETDAIGEKPKTPGQESTGEEWSRRWNRFKEHPISGGLENLRESAGSVGAMLTNAANSATFGAYGKARNLLLDAVSPGAAQAANANDQAVNAAHPFMGKMASAAGYLTPYGAPEMAARAAGAVAAPVIRAAGPAAETLAGRVLGNAGQGALAGGAVSAGEAATAGAPLPAVGSAALQGAKGGAILGGAVGAVGKGLDSLAEYADKKVSERNIADLTEGASAGRRDRVVGRAGSKADRIDSLARRTPELAPAAGDPVKQLPVVEDQLNRLDSQRDQIYKGVQVPPTVLTDSMRRLASHLQTQPGIENKAMAAHLDAQAADYESTLGPAPIDAMQARQYASRLGDNLFAGNPNADIPAAKAIKRDLYFNIVNDLNRHVDMAKPGVRPELEAMNAEYSDWANIKNAVEARASRAQTPSMTGKAIVGRGVDMLLGAMRPTHYLAKKAIEHFGPGMLRGGTDAAASMGGTGQGLIQQANPLIQATQQWQAQQAQAQKRQQDAAVVDAIFGPERGRPGPDDKQAPQQQGP